MVALAATGRLTAAGVLYAAAVTSAAGCLLGFTQTRASTTGARFSRRVLEESLSFGKWLAASIVAHWTSTQAYLYIAAVLVGIAVTARCGQSSSSWPRYTS